MLKVKFSSVAKRLLDIRFIIILFIFISTIIIEKPGLYLDAVNPDYMGLSLLYPDNVPKWAYSDNVIASMIEGSKEYSHFPLLNSLYGTCFEMYTTLLWSVFFGYSVFSIRTLHIAYSVVVLLGMYSFSKYILENKYTACIVTLLMAIEPSFMFSSRTQYYIQMFPHMTFFFGLLLIIKAIEDENRDNNKFFSGMVLLGLSACSYFVFAFYFSGVFLATFILLLRKKEWVRQCIKMILGFFVGYIPYIYAHISIMLTQGIDGWITAIKGLDTYGISDGARATIWERITHVVDSIGNILGGDAIISVMTGHDMGNVWGRFLAFIYLIAVVLAIFLLAKNKIHKSRIHIALLFMICMLLFHILLALIVGNSLGYQHFIMLLPVMILTIVLAYGEFFKYMKDRELQDFTAITMPRVFVLVMAVYAVISVQRIYEGYKVIDQTGGVGYYSESINNMAYFIDGVVSEDDTVISPQWGYWMQIACITDGEKTLWVDSDLEIIQWKMDNNPKDGDYYVVIDHNTDDVAVKQLMESHGYNLNRTESFIDYGQTLSPSIQIYRKAGE